MDQPAEMHIRARRVWIVQVACYIAPVLALASRSFAVWLVNHSQRYVVLEYQTPLSGWQRLPAQQLFKVSE